MSMYRQLWLAIIVSMALALAGSLLASMLSARAYLQSQLSIKNADNATALALSLSHSDPDPVSVELTVSALFDSGHYELIRVTDPMGQCIVERQAQPGDLNVPAWFVGLLPITAAPGQAQISDGWKQFGTITLVSHSRFAYHALWNSALQMMMALTLACVIGGYLGSLILRRISTPLRSVINQAKAITERRFITIDEPQVPELRQLASAMNATVIRLKSMFEEEASRLDAVRRAANCDSLTGLANRSYFMARLSQSLNAEDAENGLLLLVRLADLVGINRRLGRATTDEYIKRCSEVIGKIALHGQPGIAARLNGADFAVMLPGESNGNTLAESLLKELVTVTAPYLGNDTAAWIGFGEYAEGVDLGMLLARIDVALAGAEADGGNGIREATMTSNDNHPRTAEQWAKMIHHALDNRWVRLASVPVLEFSGRILHRECSTRMRFEEQGEWLHAGQFLPIAERLGLSHRFDLAAAKLGLSELSSHPELPGLAVSLSASSLSDAAFRGHLLAILAADRPSTSRLWLEVPESGAMKHFSGFREFCLALRSVDCRIGLKHFGNQFSQIGRLHDLGLDYLKVDSSFVRGIDTNSGNATFLKGLTGIAHAIGLQVLAEGVATREEFEELRAIGFDGATGPLTREEA